MRGFFNSAAVEKTGAFLGLCVMLGIARGGIPLWAHYRTQSDRAAAASVKQTPAPMAPANDHNPVLPEIPQPTASITELRP